MDLGHLKVCPASRLEIPESTDRAALVARSLCLRSIPVVLMGCRVGGV